ncbi:MAG: hybrid sensor histidine kinase/response regulator [Desulfobacterales bacterium]|nr:hybrid sensor histidine kinase/response regulator [Desulfobacterales bacterium]MBF0396201.1 hybrid sensor histidine kinase/response regulator [Desulfobacterales bacterium]
MKKISESKILIVDDTEAYIDVLVEALGGIYEILVATNGVEAMEIVKEDPPDLILLDILMPEMDGYEVCRQLKANETTREIPVIFVTSMNDIEDETRGLELGAIDYITKPISASIVRARIRNHLELKRAYQGIAEQKCKLEEQNVELLEAVRLREDVEQIMRHDLKTPLNAIIGFPQIIKLQGGLNDNQLKYIGYIEESGYRMLSMINLSLDLFKMERGIYKFNPEPVNIVDVLNNIMNEIQKLIYYKNISVNIFINGEKYGFNSNFCVQGETLLCYSMLANLIKNAVEASPEGGIISIFMENKEENAVIRIHNQSAVPINIRDRFFEKFTTSGKKKGTGLGTYSARLIAETQNGKIQMKTSEEDGTWLIIELASIPCSKKET